jgi:hypothetical protein
MTSTTNHNAPDAIPETTTSGGGSQTLMRGLDVLEAVADGR